MSEDLIVRHCAPTLAGLKTGNMFSCSFENPREMCEAACELNHRLLSKGVCTVPLKYKDGKALLYIYRPKKLEADMQCCQACEILEERGYCCGHINMTIAQLRKRLQNSDSFPHEIGLFLGYPPRDVKGFLNEKKGKPCDHVCTGYWKVYGDESDMIEAEKIFDRFRKCIRIYLDQWSKGKTIERLTV